MCLSLSLLSFDYLNPKNQELNFELYYRIVSSGGEWNIQIPEIPVYVKFLFLKKKSLSVGRPGFLIGYICKTSIMFHVNTSVITCGDRLGNWYIYIYIFLGQVCFLFFWFEQNFTMICCVGGVLLLIWVWGWNSFAIEQDNKNQ